MEFDESHERLIKELKKFTYAETVAVFLEMRFSGHPFNAAEFEEKTGWTETELRAKWLGKALNVQ